MGDIGKEVIDCGFDNDIIMTLGSFLFFALEA